MRKSIIRKQVEFLHKSVTVQSDTGCFFRNGISCGNRDKTDKEEALLSGQGFFYFFINKLRRKDTKRQKGQEVLHARL